MNWLCPKLKGKFKNESAKALALLKISPRTCFSICFLFPAGVIPEIMINLKFISLQHSHALGASIFLNANLFISMPLGIFLHFVRHPCFNVSLKLVFRSPSNTFLNYSAHSA